MNHDGLIREAQGAGDGAVAAAKELARIGVRALGPILDALDDPMPKVGQLKLALEQIYIASTQFELEEAMHSDVDVAFEMAVKAICARGNTREADLLISGLTDTEEPATRRAQIAENCGYSQNPIFIPSLQSALENSATLEREEDEPPRLTVSCIVSLARHGRFEAGDGLDPFLIDPFPPTRALAAEAYTIAVSAGMISKLSGLTTDTDYDVRLLAIEALSLLGLPACIDALIPCLEHEDVTTQNNCRISINDILGTQFTDHPEDYNHAIPDHWGENAASFDPRKRYHKGVPSTISQLVDEIDSENARHAEKCRELALLTGYQLDVEEPLEPTIRRRLNETYDSPGAIYRWGHEVQARQVL